MPDDDLRFEDVGRTDARIAEVAEVVGCETDMVMAIIDKDEWPGIVCLFTPDYDEGDPESSEIIAAFLVRDESDILREARPRKQVGPLKEWTGVFGLESDG